MASSVRLSLALLAFGAVLAGAVELAVLASGPAHLAFEDALFVLVAGIYLAAGILAWWRRPSNRMGAIMLAGCFALLVAGLAGTQSARLIAAGTVAATVILAVMVHLLHAFPSGRLRSTASRATVVAGYGVCIILQIPLYVFVTAPEPHHLLRIGDYPDLAAAGAWAQKLAGAAVMVATTVILIGRLRQTNAAGRRVLIPLYSYGMLVVLFIPISANAFGPLLGLDYATVGAIQLAAIAGVPVAFALGVLRGGFARTGELEELAAWLGARGTSRRTLRELLADTLGDPSLELFFWIPDQERFVDAGGHRVTLPERHTARAAVTIELDQAQVGAITYDLTVIGDPDRVRAAGQVVALAVDRERLTAELLASQRELLQSRERLVEAGDRERRRIAQDLHDGLQARLVLLALDAQRIAMNASASGAIEQAATRLRRRIDSAAEELREFTHAVMPAPLMERGLAAATEDLLDRLPVPATLDLRITDGRFPAAVESTAYFVLAEGLTNAIKHANARRVAVRITHIDGHVVIEVDDDGDGGADVDGGTGLRGLADRVDALGGRLVVHTRTGAGTQLVAELPCAS